jgi:hypothetical protein
MTISSSSLTIDLGGCSDSRSLLTRDQGSDLRSEVLRQLASCASVVLDLTHVDALSPSFADELFGGLESELGVDFTRLIRISCPRPEWRRLISSALTHRRHEGLRSETRPGAG